MENTSIMTHENPLDPKQTVQIRVDDPSVWKPYSAFHLAEKTLPIARTIANRNNHIPMLADIGTGSGVLAILAKQVIPEAVCIGTDLNEHAVQTASQNWVLNGLPEHEFTGIVADGINATVKSIINTSGGVDVLIANLPQQPLINGEDLQALRETNSAGWNIDPSHDKDGLGIFMNVLANSHEVMKNGGGSSASASSKQNKVRITKFLNELHSLNKIRTRINIFTIRSDVP